VCWAENLAVEGRALGLLCAQTECDVRSCLHTLQFLARRKAESSDGGGTVVCVADVQSAAAGRKDMTVAAMQAWEDIFCKKKATPFESACVRLHCTSAAVSRTPTGNIALNTHNRCAYVQALTHTRREFRRWGYTGQQGSASSRDAAEAETVAGRLMAVGDDNLLMNGIHHNLHNARFHDVNMAKHVECLEWLVCADELMGTARRTLNFALFSYVTACAMAVRRIVVQPGARPCGYSFSCWLRDARGRRCPRRCLRIDALRGMVGVGVGDRANAPGVAAGGGQGAARARGKGGPSGLVGARHGDSGAGESSEGEMVCGCHVGGPVKRRLL